MKIQKKKQKKISLIFLLLIFSVVIPTAFLGNKNTSQNAPVPKPSTDGYTLVWKEDFNGTELDTGIWNYETAEGIWNTGGNAELQHYRQENVAGRNAPRGYRMSGRFHARH